MVSFDLSWKSNQRVTQSGKFLACCTCKLFESACLDMCAGDRMRGDPESGSGQSTGVLGLCLSLSLSRLDPSLSLPASPFSVFACSFFLPPPVSISPLSFLLLVIPSLSPLRHRFFLPLSRLSVLSLHQVRPEVIKFLAVCFFSCHLSLHWT